VLYCISLAITLIHIQLESLSNQPWFKKQLEPDAFYFAIRDVFAAFGPPYGAADNKIIPNDFFGLH